jgi:hypothetical protein
MSINVDNIKLYNPTDTNEDTDNYGGGINLNSEIITDQTGNVFDNVTDQERIEGDTEYRKVFIYNHNSGVGSAWLNVKCWIFANTLSPDDDISIALGTDVDTKYDAKQYAYVKPDAIDHSDVLDLGTLASDESAAIWIKRIVQPDSAQYWANEFRLAFRSTST